MRTIVTFTAPPLLLRMHDAPRLRDDVEVAHVQPAGPCSLSTVTPPVVTRLITRAVGSRRAIGSAAAQLSVETTIH